MKQNNTYKYIWSLAGSIALLGVFLVSTNPEKTSFGLLLVPIILSLVSIYFLVQLILTTSGFLKRFPRKRPIVALAVAGLSTTIIVLQTTGGIAVVDVILLALIIVIATIYIQRY